MKKIKKVTRRSFTPKQLDMIEQYHYLSKKLWRVGLSKGEAIILIPLETRYLNLFILIKFNNK